MKEELFKKNFPEYCTEKGVCLSPYYDVFEAGVEIATAELNKGIIQSLTKENAKLKAQIDELKSNSGYIAYIERGHKIYELEKENTELKERADTADLDSVLFFNQLCKAKEIIKNLLDVAKFYNKHRDKGAIMDITPIYDAEQFLKEVNE